MSTAPTPPPPRAVTESPVAAALPIHVHPEWQDRYPWLVQGVTGRGPSGAPVDMSLFAGSPAGAVLDRWRELRRATGLATSIHAHQVHGAVVRHHREAPPGVLLVEACDGHLTLRSGLLLGVTVADCVPVTLVAPRVRAVAVVHAGWRGVAGGVAEAAIGAFRRRLDVQPGEVEAHLGPSICGRCYEVGPEVHDALGRPRPPAPSPVDLRAVLAGRMADRGVPTASITRSTWCTRCGDSPFFSHRGGDPERQMAFVGVAS